MAARPATAKSVGDAQTSSTTVTGPSLTSSSSIFAPNTPVFTAEPRARNSAQKRSLRGSASSGGAAPAKLGRFPFAVSRSDGNAAGLFETERSALPFLWHAL